MANKQLLLEVLRIIAVAGLCFMLLFFCLATSCKGSMQRQTLGPNASPSTTRNTCALLVAWLVPKKTLFSCSHAPYLPWTRPQLHAGDAASRGHEAHRAALVA